MSSAMNYGLYLGGLLTLLIIIAYAFNLELLVNPWYGIFILLLVIILGIISVAKAKGILEGFISFKQSFTTYFITVLIGFSIYLLVQFILFNFIDPEASIPLKEKTIEASIAMMEGFGAPADAIADAVDQMEQDNQFSIMNIIKGLAMYLVLFSIIGLIVAAIMKKNSENA